MSMPQIQRSPTNFLVDGLVTHERNAIHRAATLVYCERGHFLLKGDEHTGHLIFPAGAVLALVRTLSDGSSCDVAMVGQEGVVGCHAFGQSPKHADDVVVRGAGPVYSIPADAFRHQYERRGDLHNAVLRFTGALNLQLGQNAVCSRFHTPVARVARWLLMFRDRSGNDDVDVDVEILSSALSTTIAETETALVALVASGAIRTRRQGLTITDPTSLEMRACECYDTMREAYAGVMH